MDEDEDEAWRAGEMADGSAGGLAPAPALGTALSWASVTATTAGEGGVETEVAGEGAGPVEAPEPEPAPSLAWPSLLFPRLMLRLAGTVPFPIRKLLVGGRTGCGRACGGLGGTADKRDGARWNGAAGDPAREPDPAGESVRFAVWAAGSGREWDDEREGGALSSTTTLEWRRETGQRPSTSSGS